ncbi:MAG: hypothetical protein EXS05_12970 [Planctomycetaceae bacterium]|nr:hypothetical protein [Planctomycetaceae bacterium]
MKKAERTSWPCQAGTAKDQILWIAPDFDAPLEDFEEPIVKVPSTDLRSTGTPEFDPNARPIWVVLLSIVLDELQPVL